MINFNYPTKNFNSPGDLLHIKIITSHIHILIVNYESGTLGQVLVCWPPFLSCLFVCLTRIGYAVTSSANLSECSKLENLEIHADSTR